LKVTGVQHPAPTLSCTAYRDKTEIVATAPFANPVFDGRSLLGPERRPRTQMWVLLYAQVMQADGQSRRNVLLQHEVARILDHPNDASTGVTRDVIGVAPFPQTLVEALLRGLALPVDSPLSVLAVELLPTNAAIGDPVGADLGNQRILRTSPLVPVPVIC
jgi:hypothetical protein